MKNSAILAVFLIVLTAASAAAQKASPKDVPAGTAPAQETAGSAPDGASASTGFSHVEALSGYSPWTFFGGLNLLINSNGAGVTFVGINPDGSTGGLSSAPSPIAGFLGVEYRYPIKRDVLIAPSISLYGLRYLWADDRALPAELENRTAFVPTLLIDCPFLYRVERGRMLYTFGGGPAVTLRWGFLESGVGKDEKSYSEDMTAGDQVKEVNKYLWGSGRWFYPMLAGTARYRLDNGWGAGLNLRIGIPIFNLWSKPSVPFYDSMMIMAALAITPPAKKMADSDEESANQEMVPTVRDQTPVKGQPTAK
jgi:hypothetical protein